MRPNWNKRIAYSFMTSVRINFAAYMMIPEKETKRLSKWLSYLLRHHPETLDIALDENGWTAVDTLVEKIKQKEPGFTIEILQHIVDTNNKKRFSFNEDFTRIRASQGHSVKVSLGYTEEQPPEILYHGTAEKNLASIREHGLQKISRHHVHLSADEETAAKAGQRHGRPVVLKIKAGLMFSNGFSFYRSANNVWLTDAVPKEFITH